MIVDYQYVDHKPSRACYRLIGKKSDTDAVQYLFMYFVNEINRLSGEYAVEETENIVREERRLGGPGKAWFNSFRLGAVTEISNRLQAQKLEFEKSIKSSADLGLAKASNALIVLDKSKTEVEAFKQKKFPNLTKRYASGASRRDGYESGREAGRSMDLPGGKKSIGASPKAIAGGK